MTDRRRTIINETEHNRRSASLPISEEAKPLPAEPAPSPIYSERLERLVSKGLLKSYTFDLRDDTGTDPYMRLELVFPDMTKIVVLPDGKSVDGVERIGLY